jgi:hypothetical protein
MGGNREASEEFAILVHGCSKKWFSLGQAFHLTGSITRGVIDDHVQRFHWDFSLGRTHRFQAWLLDWRPL